VSVGGNCRKSRLRSISDAPSMAVLPLVLVRLPIWLYLLIKNLLSAEFAPTYRGTSCCLRGTQDHAIALCWTRLFCTE
jgi:hypothetical protein